MKLYLVLILLIFPVLSIGRCFSILDERNICYYPKGNEWCELNQPEKKFAYLDDCVQKINSTKNDNKYGFGCGAGCAVVFYIIGPVEEFAKNKKKVFYQQNIYRESKIFKTKKSYLYVNCNPEKFYQFFDDNGNDIDTGIKQGNIDKAFQRMGDFICRDSL